jgi:hypothetical protein
MSWKKLLAVAAVVGAAQFAFAATESSDARPRGGGFAGGARFSAPRAAAPRSAPRISAPRFAPRVSTPRFAPRMSAPRVFPRAQAFRAVRPPAGYRPNFRRVGPGPVRIVRPRRRFYAAPIYAAPVYTYPYVYSYGYSDGCAWLYRRAVVTGDPYWWDRYYECTGYDYY